MDKIHLKNMAFYGYHGERDEETRLGQKFFVDVTLGIDLRVAGQTDRLDKTVSYQHVFVTIRNIVEKSRYKLIETLAETIAARLLGAFPPVASVDVHLKKPAAPVDGIFDYMSVEIFRERCP